MIAALVGLALAQDTYADHAARIEGDHVVWTSHIVAPSGATVHLDPAVRVHELPAGLGPPGAGDLRVTGEVRIVTTEPLREGLLRPPLVEGTHPQRVHVWGGRIHPAQSLGAVAVRGRVVARGALVPDLVANTVRRRFGSAPGALWVSGAEPTLAASLTTRERLVQRSRWIYAGLGALLLALFPVAFRLLDRAVRRERTERYIREELGR